MRRKVVPFIHILFVKNFYIFRCGKSKKKLPMISSSSTMRQCQDMGQVIFNFLCTTIIYKVKSSFTYRRFRRLSQSSRFNVLSYEKLIPDLPKVFLANLLEQTLLYYLASSQQCSRIHNNTKKRSYVIAEQLY